MALWKEHRLRNTLLQGLHLNWSIVATTVPYVISLFLVDIPEYHKNGQYNISANHNAAAFNHFTPNQTSADYLLANPILADVLSTNPNASLHHMTIPLSDIDNESVSPSNHTPIAQQTHHSHTSSSDQSEPDVGFVRWAYVLLSFVILLNTCNLLSVYFLTRNKSKQPSSDNKTPLDTPSTSTDDNIDVTIVLPRRPSRFYQNVLLALLFVYSFLYQCVEGIPGSFLTTFCARSLGWHLDQGAQLTTVYWGMLGINRLLSVTVAWVLSPRAQITINLSLLIAGQTLMQFVHSLGPICMWLSVALCGLGLGSTLPSGFLWISEYMPITPWVVSVGNAGTSLAGVLMLSLTGYLFDWCGPDSMLYLLSSCGLALVGIFILMQLCASYAKWRDDDEMDTDQEDKKSLQSISLDAQQTVVKRNV